MTSRKNQREARRAAVSVGIYVKPHPPVVGPSIKVGDRVEREAPISHARRDELMTEALGGTAPGETLKIDLDLDEIERQAGEAI